MAKKKYPYKKQKIEFEIRNIPDDIKKEFTNIAKNMDITAQALYRKIISQTIQSFPEKLHSEDIKPDKKAKVVRIYYMGEGKREKIAKIGKNIKIHPSTLVKMQIINFVLAQPERMRKEQLPY